MAGFLGPDPGSRKAELKIKRWGTRVRPWRIHVDVWQNQYNSVKKGKYINNKKINKM